jgi:putative membrane protein
MFCNGFGSFGGYGFGPSGSIGYGWMFAAMAFRLVIFIGIVVLAYKLFKRYTNKSENTLSILNERFAKGEISEEEYIKRRTILSQKN